jgi:hypothetical protein
MTGTRSGPAIRGLGRCRAQTALEHNSPSSADCALLSGPLPLIPLAIQTLTEEGGLVKACDQAVLHTSREFSSSHSFSRELLFFFLSKSLDTSR